MIVKEIRLCCTDGGSDKVYNVFIEQITTHGGKAIYRVYAEYGKRNSVLRETDKGTYITYWKAENEFDSLVKSKRAKGYKDNKDYKIYKISLQSPIEPKRLPEPDPKLKTAISAYGRKFKDV